MAGDLANLKSALPSEEEQRELRMLWLLAPPRFWAALRKTYGCKNRDDTRRATLHLWRNDPAVQRFHGTAGERSQAAVAQR